MSLIKEFKEFAVKGNVIDMAVGLIIGAAFKSIVSSLVQDLIMPPVGKLLGNKDFGRLFFNLSDTNYETLAEASKAGAPVIRYGIFIQSIVDFIIIAFIIFMVIKIMNSLKKREKEEISDSPAIITEDTLLLREIRDSLKMKNKN